MKKAMLRLRMSSQDVHYAGDLVNGSRMLDLFGDVGTELTIWTDGDEGLFVGYDSAEFLAPVYAGDYLEIEGWVTKIGKTSRTMQFEAWKVIAPAKGAWESSCDVLKERVLVCRATATSVVLLERQRTPFMAHADMLP